MPKFKRTICPGGRYFYYKKSVSTKKEATAWKKGEKKRGYYDVIVRRASDGTYRCYSTRKK